MKMRGTIESADGKRYVPAIGRNAGEEKGHHHLYQETADGSYLPMCQYGWNRSDGLRFSIFRGWTGGKGCCKICERRAKAGLDGVEATGKHKTKWL